MSKLFVNDGITFFLTKFKNHARTACAFMSCTPHNTAPPGRRKKAGIASRCVPTRFSPHCRRPQRDKTLGVAGGMLHTTDAVRSAAPKKGGAPVWKTARACAHVKCTHAVGHSPSKREREGEESRFLRAIPVLRAPARPRPWRPARASFAPRAWCCAGR